MFALILAENSRFRENGPSKLHLTTNLVKCSYHLPIKIMGNPQIWK